MTNNGMIEAFRESTPFVIPKIFYWESKCFYQEGGRFNKAVPNGVTGKSGEG